MGLLNKILKLWFAIFNSHNSTTTTTTIVTDQTTTKGVAKKALCLGINDYPGSNNDLHGCVNDAKAWQSLLSSKFSFSTMLLLNAQVTKQNVINAMNKMVSESVSGDHIVITYSGHGTTIPDTDGDEVDGRDEALYLYDGVLSDDIIRNIINKLAKGVKFTFISDSCHSGTVTRSFLSVMNSANSPIPRYMPPKDDLAGAALLSLPLKRAIFTPEENMPEILISGCQATEYSYDASFNGRPMGAFSYYALEILRENQNITYQQFYDKLRTKLPSNAYPQTPQLEGSKSNKDTLMFR